jgi:hypothetical protein
VEGFEFENPKAIRTNEAIYITCARIENVFTCTVSPRDPVTYEFVNKGLYPCGVRRRLCRRYYIFAAIDGEKCGFNDWEILNVGLVKHLSEINA